MLNIFWKVLSKEYELGIQGLIPVGGRIFILFTLSIIALRLSQFLFYGGMFSREQSDLCVKLSILI
jgi:hypothetical protein